MNSCSSIPAGHSDFKTVLSAIGGPAVPGRNHPVQAYHSRMASIVAWRRHRCLGILAWFAGGLSPLMLSILTTAIMVVVAAWKSVSLKSGVGEAQSEATSA